MVQICHLCGQVGIADDHDQHWIIVQQILGEEPQQVDQNVSNDSDPYDVEYNRRTQEIQQIAAQIQELQEISDRLSRFYPDSELPEEQKAIPAPTRQPVQQAKPNFKQKVKNFFGKIGNVFKRKKKTLLTEPAQIDINDPEFTYEIEKCKVEEIPITKVAIGCKDIWAIWQEEMTYREKAKVLPCFHMYHAKWIDKWAEVSTKCPVDMNEVFVSKNQDPVEGLSFDYSNYY